MLARHCGLFESEISIIVVETSESNIPLNFHLYRRIGDDLVCFYFVLSGFTIAWGYQSRCCSVDFSSFGFC